MSQPSTPKPVKLIVSLISQKEKLITEASTELSQSYGKIDFMSACIPFTMTKYYQAEMGEGLMRRLITFADLLDPERFPEVKRYTDKLEARYLAVTTFLFLFFQQDSGASRNIYSWPAQASDPPQPSRTIV